MVELKKEIEHYWGGQRKVQDIDIDALHTKNASLQSQLEYSEKWRNALEIALTKEMHKKRNKVESENTPKTHKYNSGKIAAKNKQKKFNDLPIKLELFDYEREESPAKNYEKKSSFNERVNYEEAIRKNPNIIE